MSATLLLQHPPIPLQWVLWSHHELHLLDLDHRMCPTHIVFLALQVPVANPQHATKYFPEHLISHCPPSQRWKESFACLFEVCFFFLVFPKDHVSPWLDLAIPLGSLIENLAKVPCPVLSSSSMVPRKWAEVMASHTGLTASSGHQFCEGTRAGETPLA